MEIPRDPQSMEVLPNAPEFFQAIVKAAQVIVVVVTPSGRILWVNPHFEHVTGYTLDEVRGQDGLTTLAAAEDRPRAFDALQAGVSGMAVRGVLVRIVTKDQRAYPIEWFARALKDAAGTAVAVVGIGYDVSDRVRAEEALKAVNDALESRVRARTVELSAANEQLQREIEERRRAEVAARDNELRLQRILDSMSTFVGLHTPDGILIDVNRAPLEAAGLKREEVIGRPIWDTYWWSYSPEVQAELRSVVARAARGENVRYDVPIRIATSQLLETDVTFGPLVDSQGQVHQLICSAVDISERKLAQARSLQFQAALAHMCRVATMGQMATGIAHELNQPLSAIAAYVFSARDLLAGERTAQASECVELLDRIQEQSLRAGEIIRRLRAFVRKTEPRRSSCDIRELINEVFNMMAAQARLASVRVECRYDDRVPLIFIDRIQIQQVLLNLIRNSLEAMQECPNRNHELLVSTALKDGLLEVSVEDTGIGVVAEEMGKVFEEFYSTKAEGVGMGLALSRSIIESHGGRLWYEANQPAGTTFRFQLPLSSA